MVRMAFMLDIAELAIRLSNSEGSIFMVADNDGLTIWTPLVAVVSKNKWKNPPCDAAFH